MMNPYPFFGFPPFRRSYPYYTNYSLHNDYVKNQNKGANSGSPSGFSENNKKNLHTSGYQLRDSKVKSSNDSQNFEDDQEECFELFGLKLHFDDLLLIALLFFLYKEDVKDSYLYIALILLLLS